MVYGKYLLLVVTTLNLLIVLYHVTLKQVVGKRCNFSWDLLEDGDKMDQIMSLDLLCGIMLRK